MDDAFKGFVYTLRDSDTLQTNDWGFGEEVTATGSTVVFSVTLTPGDDHHFYKVERTLAP